MTHFYSPSTGGFYTRETHGARMPADVVAISARRHAELMKAQNAGARIEAGANGKPQARYPDATDRRADLTSAIRREARRRIRAVSPEWRQLNDMREPSAAGAARFAAIDEIRRASETDRKSVV